MENGTDFNFDWDAIYNIAGEEVSTPEPTRAEILEVSYQKSIFSKKWASTFEEAKTKILADYNSAKTELDLWLNKSYTPNNRVVSVGEELSGGNYSIGYINNKRKQNNIKACNSTMQDALADLERLGLTKEEISELIK